MEVISRVVVEEGGLVFGVPDGGLIGLEVGEDERCGVAFLYDGYTGGVEGGGEIRVGIIGQAGGSDGDFVLAGAGVAGDVADAGALEVAADGVDGAVGEVIICL
ncbi:MAG: hypothetical protein H6574_18255 [Lewinellaceae bacterium]|nr:hypothetical protein [Lewinellaceae bacterium]